jgi:tetratricopeptide (TPR) repeat protein
MRGAVFAEEEILLTRQAEAYYEAKEYDKAVKLFEKLLNEKLQSWQQERLLYNIGTIYLEQEKWQQAAEQYSDISKSAEQAYLIGRALKTNEAILYFREGKHLLGQSDLKLEDYSKVIYLFLDSLRGIQEAQNAQCRQEIYESNCQLAVDLNELRSAVKSKFALALDKYGEAKIADSPVKDGLPLLLAGVKLVLTHLNFLESKKLDDNLRKNYLKLFTRDAESWLLLWDTQFNQLESLEEAYDGYRKGLQKMKSEELDESRIAFISSAASLSDLIQSLWGMDPLLNLLQDLMTGYERALIQFPIQVTTLYQIETEQQQVEEIAKNTPEFPMDELNESTNLLMKSLDYVKQGKRISPRFFLNEAKQLIRRLLRTKTQKEPTPEQILIDAIEDESHAITLHRLSQEMETSADPSLEYLQKSQKLTLNTVEPFLTVVLEKEIKEYPERCQCKPWNQVIPLFEKGREAAKEAMEWINKGKRPRLAMLLQEKALKYWREALEKLRHPDEEKKPPEEKKPEPPPEEPPPLEEDQSASVDEVLRLLQQMDKDDRRPEPGQTTPQKGTRPW